MTPFEKVTKYWKLKAKLHHLRYEQDHIVDQIRETERLINELGIIY